MIRLILSNDESKDSKHVKANAINRVLTLRTVRDIEENNLYNDFKQSTKLDIDEVTLT